MRKALGSMAWVVAATMVAGSAGPVVADDAPVAPVLSPGDWVRLRIQGDPRRLIATVVQADAGGLVFEDAWKETRRVPWSAVTRIQRSVHGRAVVKSALRSALGTAVAGAALLSLVGQVCLDPDYEGPPGRCGGPGGAVRGAAAGFALGAVYGGAAGAVIGFIPSRRWVDVRPPRGKTLAFGFAPTAGGARVALTLEF